MAIYCFDTNALIEPWNNYWRPDMVPDYWDILADLGHQKRLFCPEEVEREIHKQGDDLSEWLKVNKHIVQPITQGIQKKVREVLKQFPALINVGKGRSMADPWVIAHASASGAIVVTKEVLTGSSTKYRIPDVCKNLSIECIDDFEFSKRENIKFKKV